MVKNTSFVLVIVLYLIFIPIVYAHPGNTDSYGCHTCRTNCPSWGRHYGEYHCHNSKGYDSPSYDTDYTTTPDCPTHSYYDSLSGGCKCYTGYIVSDGKCISEDQYCRDLLGFNSRYNTLYDVCECSYGYVLDLSASRCISGDLYCQNLYGIHTSYDSLDDNCKCRYGYVFNEARTKCISEDDWCQEQFGFGSEYDIFDEGCTCSDGYKFDGFECVFATPSDDSSSFFNFLQQSNTSAPSFQSEDESSPMTSHTNFVCPPNSSYNLSLESCECDVGYAPDLGKTQCVKIPPNAHAVKSDTDVWLCNNGYKEVGDTCIAIEKDIKTEKINNGIVDKKNSQTKVPTFNFDVNIQNGKEKDYINTVVNLLGTLIGGGLLYYSGRALMGK